MARSRRKVQTSTQAEETVTNIQQGTGIRCPACGGKTHVNNSVPHPKESKMNRYRECDDCGKRFLTEETIKHETVPRRK